MKIILPTTFLFLSLGIAKAEIETIFQIGNDDGSTTPFLSESFRLDEVKEASATLVDDHFYLSLGEPEENFERALTSSDPRNIIYFDLSAEQANLDGRLFVTVDFIWSGSSGPDPVANVVDLSINGTEFFTTPVFVAYEQFVVEVSSAAVALQEGTNTLEISRDGLSPNTWLAFDQVRLEVDPTALEDKDGDLIPLYWETLYQLSDNDSSDASANHDGDLLTNLQEFQRNTHPRLSDTDADGLNDDLENVTDPHNPDSDDDGLLDGQELDTNPLSIDTDDDGAPDAWEVRTGHNPNEADSTPPSFSGAIGINFRSNADNTQGFWSPVSPNGWIPQINWNHSTLLREWGVPNGAELLNGSTSDIDSPKRGALVDSAGNLLSTTIDFTYDGTWTSANSGSEAAELLNGFLRNDEAFNPSISLSDIPFDNYDIYLYLSADFFGPSGTARLNGDLTTDQILRPWGTSPVRDFIPSYQTASPRPAAYNVVRFANLSGASQTLEWIQEEYTSGIAAIQIINIEADSDGDLLPDYWEFQHQFDASLANANIDPDQDGLSNIEEFALGTNPRNPDSDGDGLSDLVETNSGVFSSASDTGTNPLFGDSDSDGISDADELTSPLPSNPTLADTDEDGVNDGDEVSSQSDPNSPLTQTLPPPSFLSPGELSWVIPNIQIVQDHTRALRTQSGQDRQVLSINAANGAQLSWRTFEFRLVMRGSSLHYYTVSRGIGGFRHANGYELWSSDFSIDQTSPLGFSGYGTSDISDPLTFQMRASGSPSSEEGWTLTFEIINQATDTTVVSHTLDNVTAPSSILDQTAFWQTESQVVGQAGFSLGAGVDVYFSPTLLETLPAFQAHADSDNDGMPNEWELTFNLDPNNPDDALSDLDNDGLNNREEYLRGTLPNNSDSDNDNIQDREELNQFSDPRDHTSTPPFFTNAPSYDPDQDRNQLPDVWEAAYGVRGTLRAEDDTDNDGYTNAQEALAGTDPLDPSSNVNLALSRPSEEELAISWPIIPGKSQTLYLSEDLDSWDESTAEITIAGSRSQVSLPVEEKQFFKGETSNLYSDNDLLDDWTELALGLSPTTENSLSRPIPHDSDGDGVSDTTISGDLAYWSNTFANASALASGDNVPAPTPFDASRLLMQASFGPTTADIDTVRRLGIEGWIDDQIENQPVTLHSDYINEITADFYGPRTSLNYSYNEDSDFINGSNLQTAFARAAISGPDQLRQRVALALSQLLVVSRRDANLANGVIGLSDYYDLLLENAFGNYEDLITQVTLHPVMGRYLSHIGNQPPAPELNRYPDENYAREVMQLFTIGLWELNQDGTQKLGPTNNPIPTYSNNEITEYARVMTGLWFGANPWGSGGWQDLDYAIPMEMHPEQHDFEPKTLLNGLVIPRRPPSQANALLDVQDAIRSLVNHDNCAPFVSKCLIQFLVTSNPNPAYIQRVASVFADDGNGTRGNLGAVVKAILMDQEARDPVTANKPEFGIYREPIIRTMHLARLLEVNRNNDMLWWDYNNYYDTSAQQVLYSPSVFNFFRPDYQAPGTLTNENLVGPAFEITNSYSAVSFPNQLWNHINEGFSLYSRYHFPGDYSVLLQYADDHEALLDYINLVACAGHMTISNREIILSALNETDSEDDPGRVKLALYLALMSPHGAVQR